MRGRNKPQPESRRNLRSHRFVAEDAEEQDLRGPDPTAEKEKEQDENKQASGSVLENPIGYQGSQVRGNQDEEQEHDIYSGVQMQGTANPTQHLPAMEAHHPTLAPTNTDPRVLSSPFDEPRGLGHHDMAISERYGYMSGGYTPGLQQPSLHYQGQGLPFSQTTPFIQNPVRPHQDPTRGYQLMPRHILPNRSARDDFVSPSPFSSVPKKAGRGGSPARGHQPKPYNSEFDPQVDNRTEPSTNAEGVASLDEPFHESSSPSKAPRGAKLLVNPRTNSQIDLDYLKYCSPAIHPIGLRTARQQELVPAGVQNLVDKVQSQGNPLIPNELKVFVLRVSLETSLFLH